jgi:outer membrane protein OmpA-like peptidoglycan-associated protein
MPVLQRVFAGLLTVLPLALMGQTDSVTLSEQYFQMGMDIFDYQHRKQASELFILAARANPKNAKAHFMAGQSIMLSLRKERSLPYYKKAYALDPRVSADILFHLGQAYHYAELFDSALVFYYQHRRQMARSLSFEKVKQIMAVDRKIFECYNAKVMMAHPVNVTITHLGQNINSEYPDYAPAIDASENLMIFTTRRPEGNTNLRVAQDHEYYEDIFISKKINGAWTPATNLAGSLNTNYHNASINLSPDGKEMLTYHDTNGGDIFASILKSDGTWSEPEAITGINSSYIENSATITSDGNTIYFTSNRPGGFGGTDIYMSTKDSKGKWTKPQNLGDQVNTEFDEDAVFISANGKHLYFSSNGHPGMGDLDIFRASFNEEKKIWEKPINMGYPINSVENDIYFTLTGDENIAYFSSIRDESYGEEDIYKLDISQWEPPAFTHPKYEDVVFERAPITPLPPVNQPLKITTGLSFVKLKIYVAEGGTKIPVEANVLLSSAQNPEQPLRMLSPGLYETDVTDLTDKAARYQLHITATGYIPYSTHYYFFGHPLQVPEIVDTVYLDKIVVNYNRVLHVYFETNSAVPKSLDDIQYLGLLMKSSPTLKLAINGYTDNTGVPEYNIALSKRRCETVKKYLVDSGIDSSRIITNGYGAENPIADNNTREGRQLNRRTEFTIIEK